MICRGRNKTVSRSENFNFKLNSYVRKDGKVITDMGGIKDLRFALITAARNEQAFLEKTIQSIISQTVLPVKWVIVNDGSSDATPGIIDHYTQDHPWIERLDMPAHRDRSFAAKAYCINAGYQHLSGLDFEVIGNIDADVSFDKEFFEFLIGKFCEMPQLGVAGTVFHEDGYDSSINSFEGEKHVSGQCQLFRRKCFDEIGCYTPHAAGGVDWIAVATARMKGWTTRSFREKHFFHHRHLGTAERSSLASRFSYGEKDYYLGNHPLWEVCRVFYQLRQKPMIMGGVAIGAGYLSAALRRINRPISAELMQFHRKEEMQKLRAIFRSLFQRGRVDSFSVMSGS
jgi:glycosyltransferase involved in cell wall biosynthesis